MFRLSPSALQWIGVGLLLVVLGGLIAFREWTFLIAGYDVTSSVPTDVAANVVGNTVLRLGLAAVALGVFAVITEVPPYLSAIFGVVVLLAVARLLYRLRTYSPTKTT
jgi:hypothetical protein